MRKIILVFLVLGLISCTDKAEHNLVGTWNVRNYTLWEKGVAILSGVRSFEVWHNLILNSDSTYSEQSCGNTYKGRWLHAGDSVILNCERMWYRKAKWVLESEDCNYDSISGNASHSRTAFFIGNNKLVKVDKGKRFRDNADGSKELVDGNSITILK